jgi:pyruvate/2-oxoglutarate dehydrogenase complex dihydrolipoamide dehydrogenase (E3) component
MAEERRSASPSLGSHVLVAVGRRRVSQRLPGYPFYIDPLVARVGLADAQALATGRPMLRAMRPMTRVGRAVEKGETQGFMKIVVDAETRRVFGAAILGTGGDEAIHGALDMMSLTLKSTYVE